MVHHNKHCFLIQILTFRSSFLVYLTEYALARSLEGSFATSNGVVSDPDISMVNLSEMLAERELCSVVLASDGLFEVIDNEQADCYVIQWREAGSKADEVAKQLCRKTLELGSPDNISVVVLYLT